MSLGKLQAWLFRVSWALGLGHQRPSSGPHCAAVWGSWPGLAYPPCEGCCGQQVPAARVGQVCHHWCKVVGVSAGRRDPTW